MSDQQTLFTSSADLGEYLFRITDNGGATADRYTVAFSDGECLCLSSYPSHPQGVSQTSEFDPQALQDRIDDGTEIDLSWGDLPLDIRSHVLARLNEGFRDFLSEAKAATSRDDAKENEGLHSSAGDGIYTKEGAFYIKREGDDDSDDLGPYETFRDALLASLPDHYSLSGPEYHSTATGNGPVTDESHPAIQAALQALESRVRSAEQ